PRAQQTDMQSLAKIQSLAKKGNNDLSNLADNYIIQFTGDGQRVRDAVANIGGKLEFLYDQIGVASVKGIDASKAAKLQKTHSVNSVTKDIRVNWLTPSKNEGSVFIEDYTNPPSSGDDDFYFDLQWGHDAVNAPEAWNAGYKGAGARVGVLDTGFDLDHPDLYPNINFNLSADFTGEGLQYSLTDAFSHGTHTAGTIAAADNGFGTFGVAPEAELVLIKVLGDTGSGSFGNIIDGIVYAALVDVDVINMSIGATFSRRGGVYNDGELVSMESAKDISELVNAIGKAVTFVYQTGTTVITSAGNEATDYDHNADLIHVPSGVPHALAISATAPVGWAADPNTNLDMFASTYSNYGQSEIDFAAPGGNYAYAFELGGNDLAIVAGIMSPAYIFDYVFSTGNGAWYWYVGTSMASPQAAGFAALIIGKNGGSMAPSQVEAILKQSADDLGKKV
ncbi:MAG: S8 family serine peptidase, partial [Calditrichaceae bacterium]